MPKNPRHNPVFRPTSHSFSAPRPFLQLAASVRLLVFLVVLSSILGSALGCGQPTGDDADPGPVSVVVTTGMIAYSAERIAGELLESGQVTVEGLMGPGVDPHLYKASESDVRKLSEAELVLYNGLFLEGKMGDILVKLARSRPVVAISETIPEAQRREPPELQGHYDPHIWFDVSLWASTLAPMVDAMVEALPEHEATLRRNGEAYAAELAELDAWAQGRVNELPAGERILVTAHDAFGYFGDRYGMEVIGVQGMSTVAEAGLQDVQRVVDLILERRIPALFVESSVPRRTIEAVQAACADQGHPVRIGGELFSDAMGAPDTAEGTYPGMVRHNVNTIVDSLLGMAAGGEGDRS
ncbi:MAG: zinc ABC transporter substrate-binding protein [Holophagales bacterium]|nr:zinc ABC transporter substrate-binding protein [Holophagales bacterium]